MKIQVNQPVEVEVKTVKVHAKCCDMCSVQIYDTNGNRLKDHDGYVPGFFPGDHYGDYLILDIDINTGVITNWKKPSEAELTEFINREDE